MAGILADAQKSVDRKADYQARAKKAWDTRGRNPKLWEMYKGGDLGRSGAGKPEAKTKDLWAKKLPSRYAPGSAEDDGSAPTPDDNPMGLSEKVVVALRESEAKHAADATEQALIIGSDGTVALEKTTGHAARVRFTPDDVPKMVGGVATHNHPSGGPFSPDDINLLIENNMKEIRAVGNPAKGGTLYRFGQSKTDRTKDEAAALVVKALGKMTLMRQDLEEDVRAGRMSEDEASGSLYERQHAVLLEIAKIPGSGFYYKRTRGKANA